MTSCLGADPSGVTAGTAARSRHPVRFEARSSTSSPTIESTRTARRSSASIPIRRAPGSTAGRTGSRDPSAHHPSRNVRPGATLTAPSLPRGAGSPFAAGAAADYSASTNHHARSPRLPAPLRRPGGGRRGVTLNGPPSATTPIPTPNTLRRPGPPTLLRTVDLHLRDQRRARDQDQYGDGDDWAFQYDALGNLLSVGLPNGDLVEYRVDGLGRRVGKKKNGVLLKQWNYCDALKPVAELHGGGRARGGVRCFMVGAWSTQTTKYGSLTVIR
jgi:YD repeat-containing protein